jgi:hypothetical protein
MILSMTRSPAKCCLFAEWRIVNSVIHKKNAPQFDRIMKATFRFLQQVSIAIVTSICFSGCVTTGWDGYRGTPFRDTVYQGGAQKIPGRVQCAYYDAGGEGVAYHDADAKNNGSGNLNPANGSYLNEFRLHEGVDISYTKFHDAIDDNPYDLVKPPADQLYVGWTEPGEWFNLTVRVERAGIYSMDLLYTSNRGGTISLERNGKALTGPIKITSTRNDAETVAWRQWHHWNVATNMAEVELPKGVSVLTLRVLTEGNMNFAYLDFKPKAQGR